MIHEGELHHGIYCCDATFEAGKCQQLRSFDTGNIITCVGLKEIVVFFHAAYYTLLTSHFDQTTILINKCLKLVFR